jgi:hypothetical protein
MPDQPSWIDRVPQILEAVSAPGLPPFLDRSGVERLFSVSPRQANRLIQRWEGYRVGRSILVSREALQRHLEQRELRAAGEREHGRKRRISETLGVARIEARRRSIPIPVLADSYSRQFEDLPAGIQLEPGELKIRFDDSTELLQKLFELAQAISNDPQRFQALADQPTVDMSTVAVL